MALTVWLVLYLGLLPCFLAQLRWLGDEPARGTMALALAIFVPKSCDIGAYFTGRLLRPAPDDAGAQPEEDLGRRGRRTGRGGGRWRWRSIASGRPTAGA